MKRYSGTMLGLALMVAGCGSTTTPTPKLDMTGPTGDLATSSTDDAGGGDLSMASAGGDTGAPCVKDSDCAGVKPTCIQKDGLGLTWPGGYCMSSCNPNKNDAMTALNSSCPGGLGTCAGTGSSGSCEVACSGAMSCKRTGYSCFTNGCEPTTQSDCDPTKKGSCPQDGGIYLTGANPDSGALTYSGRTCTRTGDDNVGSCGNGCDPFLQNCPDDMGNMQGCFASSDTGESGCSDLFNAGNDGDSCVYLNACNPGLSCWSPPGMMNATSTCRPFCGGPKGVACQNGKKCADLSMTVKSTTVGACGG